MDDERWFTMSAAMADIVNDAFETVCLGYPDDLSQLDPAHRVPVQPLPCDRPGQLGATLLGLTFNPCWVVRSCRCNFVRALVLRHGVRRPPVRRTPFVPSRFLEDMRQAYIDAACVYEGSWLSKWPASKARAILESIAVDPVSPDRLKSFIKREISHSFPKRPRAIQGYLNLHTQALFGPQQTSFQKGLASLWTIDGYELYPGIFVTMASGVSALDLGRWMDLCEAYDFFYERDGKNWDATMGLQHHALKWLVMDACDEELGAFVRQGYRCRGVHKGQTLYRYELSGTVKSGHNDTTSGNTLVNAFICADALRRSNRQGRIIVAGDDLLAAVRGNPFPLEELEAEYGIKPEARWFSDPQDATFISGGWLWGGRWVFAPLLGRLLARLFWSVKPPSKRRRDAHLYGIAAGLQPTVECLPVYRDFIAPYLRLGSGTPSEPDRSAVHKPRGPNPADPDLVLASMSVKYSLSPDALRRFGEKLRHSPTSPCVASDPVAEAIITRDLADIADRGAEAY